LPQALPLADTFRIPGARVQLADELGCANRTWFLFWQGIAKNAYKSYSTQPSDIIVTGSPFTYTNSSEGEVDILVANGGVTRLEFSRNGTTLYNCGSYYGMFRLSPYDNLIVTYTTAPTLTLIPR